MRASPGSGHIRVRQTGKGERYDVLVREDGKQRTLEGGLTSRAEAETYLAAWHVEREAAGKYVPVDTGIMTVRKLGAAYLSSLSPEKLGTDGSLWSARVEPAEFIDWPLTQLDERGVRRWVDTMARTPIASGKRKGHRPQRQTLQNALNLLRAAFKWAVIRGHTDVNPAKNVSISDSTTETLGTGAGDYDYLHVDEVRRILEAPVLPQRARVAFTLLAFTGARPKDLYLLTWDRVDIAGQTVRFRTHKQDRDYLAHLLPVALDALREWWAKSGRRATGLVFPGPDGKPHAKGYDWGWASVRARRKWTKRNRQGHPVSYRAKATKDYDGWRAKIGIRRPVALYSLRHTCASQLLLGAELFTGGRIWSLPEIASHLGHADTKTVERYAKALGVASKRAVEESRAAIKASAKGKK